MARKGSTKEVFRSGHAGLEITVHFAGKLDDKAIARFRPMAALAAGLGLAARSRNLTTGLGANGEDVGKHFITGGMWQGLATKVRSSGKVTNTIQGKSKSSYRKKNYGRRPDRTYVYNRMVPNMVKAWAATGKHVKNILTNTPEELEAARSVLARAVWQEVTANLTDRGEPPALTGDPHVIRFLRPFFL